MSPDTANKTEPVSEKEIMKKEIAQLKWESDRKGKEIRELNMKIEALCRYFKIYFRSESEIRRFDIESYEKSTIAQSIKRLPEADDCACEEIER